MGETAHDTQEAHSHSAFHASEVKRSDRCGCFYCFRTFARDKIKDWIDGGETARCPFCGVDSVIGSASGVPLTQEFLREMHEKWFSVEGVRMDIGGADVVVPVNDPVEVLRVCARVMKEWWPYAEYENAKDSFCTGRFEDLDDPDEFLVYEDIDTSSYCDEYGIDDHSRGRVLQFLRGDGQITIVHDGNGDIVRAILDALVKAR